MQWKEIATKLDKLAARLSTAVHHVTEKSGRKEVADPERAADRWIRRYARSRRLRLPSDEVVRLVLARAVYAADFAHLAPKQELEVANEKAVEVVESLMIDLWHLCLREKWRR